MENNISKMYYDPKTGFLSASKLYKKLHPVYPEIKLKEIQAFIDKQYSAQLNKQVKKPKKYNTIFSPAPRNNFQMDIIVYDRYAFHNYKYILVVIDVYSRYVACRAMTNRNMSTILAKTKDIFKEMGVPNNLNCDNEFNKKEFNKFVQDHNITMYYSQPDEINKNAIVERFNRTIAELLQRWRTATGKYDWYKVLPAICQNYNNTFHRTIKDTPSNLFLKKKTTNQQRMVIKLKFKVGDKVRKKVIKKVFDKGDILKFSKDVYIIRMIDKNKIYLTNTTTDHDLEQFVKDYEIKPVGEIQYKPNADVSLDEFEHGAVQTQRKQTRAMNKEGVKANEVALRRTTRERRPVAKLINKKGERVIWP